MLLEKYINNNEFQPFNKIIEQLNDNIVGVVYVNKEESYVLFNLKNGLNLKLTKTEDNLKKIYRFEIINDENIVIEKISFHFWNLDVVRSELSDHDTTVSHQFYEFEDGEVIQNDLSYKFSNGILKEENSFALRSGIDYDLFDEVKHKDKYDINKAFSSQGRKYACELTDINDLEFLKLKSKGFQKVKK